MKRNWELDELIEHFTLTPQEMWLIGNKTDETRLGFVVMLKYFQHEGQFPNQRNQIPPVVVEYIAKQINCDPELFPLYDWSRRVVSYHRSRIREFLGVREPTVEDFDNISTWLADHVLTHDYDLERVRDAAYGRFRELNVEPVTPDRIEQLIRSAIRAYEDRLFISIHQGIPQTSLLKIDELIESVSAISELDDEDGADSDCLSFQDLKSDPGRVGLETVLREATRLRIIRNLDIPDELLKRVPPKVLRKYRQMVATEDIRELRRHPEPIRYALLSIFFYLRGMEITDNLVELPIQIIHRIGVRAERKVD